ncbi:MAG TPA: hypothetical protein VIP80_15730 [Gemmatimonadales bacterium]
MALTTLAGLLLTAIVSGIAYRVWGEQAAVAAAVFGALALAIQLGALGLMRPVRAAPFQRFLARWGAGMGLRLLGVLAIALAAGLDPRHFPPLPTAAGFLGVLLPLLFFEVRLIR